MDRTFEIRLGFMRSMARTMVGVSRDDGGGGASQYPSVLSRTPTSSMTPATSHSIAMPAVVVAGNLLLMVWTNDNSTRTVTTPSGWTLLATGSGSVVRSCLFIRVSDGGEGGTNVTVTVSGTDPAAAHVYRIGNWNGNTANVEAAYAVNSSASGSLTGVGLTPTFGQKPALWIVTTHSSSTTVPTDSTSGFTNFLLTGDIGTTPCQVTSAYDTRDVASISAPTWSMSSTSSTTHHCASIAIRGTI